MATTDEPVTAGPETGWGPDTPVDDNILRQFVVGQADAWAGVATASGGRTHRDDAVACADLGRGSGLFNSAVLTSPAHGDRLDEVLDVVEEFYSADGQGEVLLWSPWPTAGLRHRGCRLEGHPPMLYRPAGPIPAADGRDPSTLVDVDDETRLREWSRTVVRGFPFDDVHPEDVLVGPAILDDDRFRFHLGSVDSEPVCAGSQFVDHGQQLLFLTATDPGARGREHYGAMVRHRLGQQPDLPATALVSDDSRPILTRHFGFAPIIRFTLWTRPRP